MKIFKFGGASVKDADAIRNVGSIIQNNCEDQVFVVVSAIGKTTNALEKIVASSLQNIDFAKNQFLEIINAHKLLSSELLEEVLLKKIEVKR